MSGDVSAERVDRSGNPDERSPTAETVSKSKSEELLEVAHIDGSGAGVVPVAADEPPSAEELERRLHEQVENNALLDSEVRYLMEELAVRQEFIRYLEDELASIHTFAGRQVELATEFAAYRSRISHRIVDRFVNAIHRVSWLRRSLKPVGRVVKAIAARSSAHRSASPSRETPQSNDRSAEFPNTDHRRPA